MCHGHPHFHPCQHTSVKWLFCPEASFDLKTGWEAPCSNPIYSTAQPVTVDCPLKHCTFKAMKGSWMCCACNQGPNTQGWCTQNIIGARWEPGLDSVDDRNWPHGARTCGHGCCSNCTRAASSRAGTPEVTFVDMRKGKSGRKSHAKGKSSNSHKRGSIVTEYADSVFSAAIEEESSPDSSSSHHTPHSSAKKSKAHSHGRHKSSHRR